MQDGIKLFNWLLKFCKLEYDDNGRGPIINPWEATGTLAAMLGEEQSSSLVSIATNHHYWKSSNVQRIHLVKAVQQCIRLLPNAYMYYLAKAVIPLITDVQRNRDYVDVLGLLIEIAHRGDETIKSLIASETLPSSDRPMNVMLWHLASAVGSEIPKKSNVINLANKAIYSLDRQVQEIGLEGLDEDPETVMGQFDTMCSTVADKKVAVQLCDTVGLHAIARYQDLLEPSILHPVVASILNAVKNPLNALSNKESLIAVIGEFADSMLGEQATEVVHALEIVACGGVDESTALAGMTTSDPFARFKFNGPGTDHVRGIAISALVRMEMAHPGVCPRLTEIIEAGLRDNVSIVRERALWALYTDASLIPGFFNKVLLSTQDTSNEVAKSALDLLARVSPEDIANGDWSTLLHALTLTSQSSNVDIRRSTANVVRNLQSRAPAYVQVSTSRLFEMLSSDICFSVRTALKPN